MFFYSRVGVATFAVAAALALAFSFEVRAESCPPGTVQIGEQREETETAIIIHPVCRRLPVDPAVVEKFCSSKRDVMVNMRAIRQLRFDVDIESYDQFAKVAEEQKEDIKSKLFSAFIDQSLAIAKVSIDNLEAINLNNVNRQIKKLDSLGLKNQKVTNFLYKVAEAPEKHKRAKAYQEFIEQVEADKTKLESVVSIADDPDHAGQRFLIGALQIAQSNPELGLIVTGVDIGENLLYLAYMPGQLEKLTKLTDDKMSALSKYTAQMKKSMEQLKAAKRQWQKSGMGGEPGCVL